MAYRELGMWEVLDVLQRVQRGETKSGDEALAARVAQRLRPGPATPPEGGASEALLTPHRDQLRAWLAPEDGTRGLRLSKVRALLVRQGVAVPYSSLHRFAVAQCGFQEVRRRTVRRAECAPGELAEVDFGRLGLVGDPETQRRRVAHALLVTLVYSRHQYVYVSFSQTLADLVTGLEEAWSSSVASRPGS